jgi:hypothetical protein
LSGRHLTATHAQRRGWLPGDDPLVTQAEAAMDAAGRRLREATQRLDALPRQIEAAQAARRTAEREAWLAAQRPELMARRAALQAEAPVDGAEAGESYRQRAVWRQAVHSLQSEIDAVLMQAGV